MRKLSNSTFTFLLLLISLISQAQTGGKLSGRVIDNQGSGLSSATIAILKSIDSSTITTVISNKSGNYIVAQLPAGKYLLKVSAIGYRVNWTRPVDVSATAANIEIPAITLTAESKELNAVTVTAARSMIEMKIDRTVLNVEAAVTNTGANALEVLEKVPGVQVDKDGNISLKGKQGVVIMLDGRPTYLSGPELANLLRGMQASQLDQVEVMTNPPAKYDAAGNSGIINIKTKKNKIKGFNGNLTAGVGMGVYGKTNESISLNYRDNKINIFTSYSFGWNKQWRKMDILRRFKNEDNSTRAIFEQKIDMPRNNHNNNFKVGMDYYVSKKTTLGLVFSGYYNTQDNPIYNVAYLKNAGGVVDSIVEANNREDNTWKNGSINLNMRHQFDTTGRELTVDADYIVYDAPNKQHFINTTFMPDWVKKQEQFLRGELPSTINIYSVKADYTHPIRTGTKMDIGFKSSYVTNDSKARYFKGNPENGSGNIDWTTDFSKTNYFDYKENINAAYVSINHQFNPKWGMQTGLRYEQTNMKGLVYGNPTAKDSSFKRSYDSWFPTVYFSFNANKNNQFGLSYGRRIDRPGFQDMNPFMFFIDNYTYAVGNPYLRPQYSNNFEFTHIWKSKLTTTLNYSITKDVFNEVFEQDNARNGDKGFTTIIRDGNIGKRQTAGISINAQLQPAKWVTTNIYTNLNYNKYSGQLRNEYLEIDATKVMLNINNQFRFGKGWSGELSGWWRSKGLEGQIQLDPMSAVSAGIAKQVLKGNGSIKFNVRDIFFSQIAKGEINFESTETYFRNVRETRVANITFTYRFGKPIKNGNGERKRNENEEQNRVQKGN